MNGICTPAGVLTPSESIFLESELSDKLTTNDVIPFRKSIPFTAKTEKRYFSLLVTAYFLLL